MDKIKELQKVTEEHLQESKRSYKKLINKQGSGESQKEDAETEEMSDQQQKGSKRRRVSFIV